MSVSVTAAETLAPLREAHAEEELEALKLEHVLHQQPISVTLDGPTICFLSLALVLLIHFADSYYAEVFVSFVPVVLFIRNDYQNFLNLGPGGVPSTFAGYLKITVLRTLRLRNPFVAPKAEPSHVPSSGVLAKHNIPYRSGPRPIVAGIAPQRQIDQHGSRFCYRTLRRTMAKLGDQYPNKFGTERSCLEKHGLALFAKHPLQTNCQGEICHVHDSDHSMHMCLHPDDLHEVLSKGWGQMHPLAWKSRFFKSSVSPYFVMIYAPRNEDELQVVCNIIEASIWNTLAEDVELKPALKSA